MTKATSRRSTVLSVQWFLARFLAPVVSMILGLAPALAEGKVSGLVTDPAGKPLSNIRIVLQPQTPNASHLSTKTSKKGAFLFGIVPEGQYTLAVEGTTLAPHSVKIKVVDIKQHVDVISIDGPPPSKPTVFDVAASLDVTYNIVLGDPDKTPAAIAAAEAARRAAGQSAGAEIPGLLQSGDYQAALAKIDEALKTAPDDPGLRYYRGYALFRLKQPEAARTEIQRSLEINPAQVGAHFVLGGIHSEAGNRAEALAEFEKELANNTDKVGQVNSWVNIGLIQRSLSEEQRSLERKEKAAGHGEAAAAAGAAASAAADKAIAAFEKVLELDEKQPEAYGYLADLYLAKGQAEKAAEVQAKSGSLGLEDPKAVFNLGATYWNNKDFDKAEAAFRHAVELDPSFGLAWKNLGYALVNLGKTPEAMSALRKYLELEPKADDAKDVRDLIEALGKDAGKR